MNCNTNWAANSLKWTVMQRRFFKILQIMHGTYNFFQQGEKAYKIVKGRPKRVRTVNSVMISCDKVVGLFKYFSSSKILPIHVSVVCYYRINPFMSEIPSPSTCLADGRQRSTNHHQLKMWVRSTSPAPSPLTNENSKIFLGWLMFEKRGC